MNNIKWLKRVNAISVLVYIVAYILVFCAFNDRGVTDYDEPYFGNRFTKLMFEVGAAFTVSVISYLWTKNKHKNMANIVSFICNALQILVMIYAISLTMKLIDTANERCFEIGETLSTVGLIMWHVIICVSVVGIFISICRFVTDIRVKGQNEEQIIIKEEPIDTSYLHVPVIVVLVSTVMVCILYMYGVLGLILMPFILIMTFVLPISLLLAKEVRTWIESGKYMRAAVCYGIYAYLVYGAIYRLFDHAVDGFNVHSSATDLLFDGCIQLVNVVAGMAVAIILMVKAIKQLRGRDGESKISKIAKSAGIILFLLAILLWPRRFEYRDGEVVEYKALLYTATATSKDYYLMDKMLGKEESFVIEIYGLTVYEESSYPH